MFIAGLIELIRMHDCSDTASHSTLSVYTQFPQHISIGFAQTFGLLASFEFAYFIAPRSAKSLFMSFHFISRILSDYIVEAYMVNFKSHFIVSDISSLSFIVYEYL